MARTLTCDICDESTPLVQGGPDPRGWKKVVVKIEKTTLKTFEACAGCAKEFVDRSDELLLGFPAVEHEEGGAGDDEAEETEEEETSDGEEEETSDGEEEEEGESEAPEEGDAEGEEELPAAAAPKWERRPGEHQRKDWHLQLDKACELKVGYEPSRQWVARVIVNGKTTDHKGNFENRGEAMGWVTKQANFGG